MRSLPRLPRTAALTSTTRCPVCVPRRCKSSTSSTSSPLPPSPASPSPPGSSPVVRYYGTPDLQPWKAGKIRADLLDGWTERGGPRRNRKYNLFRELVLARFQAALLQIGPWRRDHKEWHSFGLHSQQAVDREVRLFRSMLNQAFALASDKGFTGRTSNPLFWSLRNAFIRGDAPALSAEIRYAFQTFVLRSRFSRAVTATHERLADLRYPYEWFPATRTMQRTIHLHVGPTNSGKTYHALKALEAAKTGIYAGPLRLLAHEVYTRFQAKGRRTALITGEEQRIPEGDDDYFSSCTVEMTPLNKRVDVAVIDEIQMIADDERGWAWTQAVLGVQAREVHLCGEERAVDLIQSICARIGDKCVVHTYKRLTSLQPMKNSLGGSFKNLRKGDAVVAFSRVALHALKGSIEEATGRRCAIVYGSLPPETRAQQAALFNDPDNDYDFLVASDAIGMGLNLEIKRVIFESATKHDGVQWRTLTVPEMKQIGGRAGRFRTAAQDIKAASETTEASAESQPEHPPAPAPTANSAGGKWGAAGYVTSMEEEDLDVVRSAFDKEPEPLKAAGVLPPTFLIERFYNYFPPGTPLSFVLLRLREMAKLSGRFRMCNYRDILTVADVIQPFPMSIYDRCIFLSAPVSLRDIGQRDVLKALAKCVSEMSGGHLLDIAEIRLEILDATKDSYDGGPVNYLRQLEALHKSITLYLWLTYRYTGVFPSQALAFHVKTVVEEKITQYLEGLNMTQEARQQRQRRLRKLAQESREVHESILEEEDAAGEAAHHEGPGVWNEEGHEEPLLEDADEADEVVRGGVRPGAETGRGRSGRVSAGEGSP